MVKMTSFEVIHTEGACNDSADSAEFSFLPIPSSTSPEPEPVNFDMRNLQSTLITATPDLTMEEVQQRLLDMLQENEELKEALKKNNLMMQEQLSIVSSWHEQMVQAKNKQQSKIEEADKIILNYQEQNEKLTIKIKEMESKIEEYKKKEENLKESVIISDEELGYTVISHTTKEKQDNLMLQLADLDEKATNLNNQLVEKDAEIALLKNKIAEQEEKLVQCQKLKEGQEEAVKASYGITQSKLDMASSLAEKYKERCDSQQQQIDEYEAKLEKIKMSDSYVIDQLQESVKTEIGEKEQIKQKLVETEKNVVLLSNELDKVNKQLQIQNQEQEKKDKISDSTKEVEDRKHLEEIDVLTAKLMYTEQELEAQQEKVQELQTTLETLTEDSESLPILKAQVEVYKVDFNNEKIAKENAQNLADALQEKIKLLEQQLSSSDCSPTRPKSKHFSRHSKRAGAAEDGGHSGTFTCPLCNLVFPDLKAVENHCDICTNEFNNVHF